MFHRGLRYKINDGVKDDPDPLGVGGTGEVVVDLCPGALARCRKSRILDKISPTFLLQLLQKAGPYYDKNKIILI